MKQSMTRRFYATASAVEYSAMLGTMGEATEAAKIKLTETGSKANKLGEIYIVEVVKIVRFESEPEDKPIEIVEIRK